VLVDNNWGSAVVSCYCGKLVAEDGDNSGTQSAVVSRYQATASVVCNTLRTSSVSCSDL
jgi:hypothetical protein